ncbi:MAG TPA: hypothetical protein VK844_07200 [Hyphomicrobiales bacterium]|nr:hypothetical protein [Hyphomicrobiales bacterium]
MSLAAAFLGGAKSRLLPVSIPFRFFYAGVVFHVLMWFALLVGAEEAAYYTGGLGMMLGALHFLTLGVFATVAVGAALQMLPVATRQPMPTSWPIRLGFWLFVPAILVLVHGMATYDTTLMMLGGTFAGAGLLLLAYLLADNLRRAKDLPLVAAFGWLATVSLVLLVLLGVALIFDFDLVFLPDHAGTALAHLILAVIGFLGMLAVGFSHILVPMFALSPAPPRGIGKVGFAFWVTAIAVGIVGAFLEGPVPLAAAVLLALAGAGVYLWTMAWVWRRRMRQHLGLSFVMARLSWALLPVGLLIALAALFDLAGANGATLAGFVLLWGWLLTFILAILQRIMPFLASMHAPKVKGKPPLVSELTPETPLRIHAACHVAALILIAAGIALDLALAVRIGAAVGLAGSLAFAAFTVPLTRRLFFVRGDAA